MLFSYMAYSVVVRMLNFYHSDLSLNLRWAMKFHNDYLYPTCHPMSPAMGTILITGIKLRKRRNEKGSFWTSEQIV